MNIAIIGSGGDGAGMNECLYVLCQNLKQHNIVLFNYGYQGIIDDNVAHFSLATLRKERKNGGIIIKSSRSSEFMTEQGFAKAINTLKKHKIDVLIVMGGNGSWMGAKALSKAGINVMFIPTTIDNDIATSDYSIGFYTAIANAVDFIKKVDTSMKAFDRTCIYEVMGRHCQDLAQNVARQTDASFCFVSSSDKENMYEELKEAYKTNLAPIIILQENTTPAEDLKKYLQGKFPEKDFKVAIVGYVQRGGIACREELEMAKGFALKTVECIENKLFNKIITFNQSVNNFEEEEI